MPPKIEKRPSGKFRLTVCLGYDSKGKQLLSRKTVAATNITEAKNLYRQYENEILKTGKNSLHRHTFKTFYPYWRENYSDRKHEMTTKTYNNQLIKRIIVFWDNTLLIDITPELILKFHRTLEKDGLSALTVQKYHKFAKSLLNKAVQWKLIASNPFDNVDTPHVPIKRKEIYATEKLKSFLLPLAKEPLKYQIMVYLGLQAGLRREEIFGLEWKHILCNSNELFIEQAAPVVSGHSGYLKTTKTTSSTRKVSIPSSLIKLLQKHHLEQSKLLLEYPSINRRVFTQESGKPAHPTCFNSWLIKYCTRNDLPRITPHDFRHLSVTYLSNLGIDIKTISTRVGHSRTSTTVDIYSHFIKKSDIESGERIGDFIDHLINEKVS